MEGLMGVGILISSILAGKKAKRRRMGSIAE